MAALQRVAQSSVITASSSYGSCRGGVVVVGGGGGVTSVSPVQQMAGSDPFPAGLRVLVVDDDLTCLRILEKMLARCLYHVTTCSQATVALNLLREKKGCYDVVLSDVHMPDMDGFKLLELVGLEMDLPVIMMSADEGTSAVMKGVRHGACDYLIKPIRETELKNIWQHVVRKKWNGCKEIEQSGSLEDNDQQKPVINSDVEYTSSINEGTEGILKGQKKRSNPKEDDDGDMENDDVSTSKKPRVVWSVELHQQFVSAVNQLGLDKAVPKRILELMNVPGLSRENVASHLQKFRLYLKRLSLPQQQCGISNAFCGPGESNTLSRFDIQALAASGQIPPQTLAILQAELLGQPVGNLVPAMDQPALLRGSLQGPKRVPVEHGMPFMQPMVKSQSNVPRPFPHSILSAEDVSSSFGQWRTNSLNTVPCNNLGGLGTQSSNLLMDVMQQEQRQHKKAQQQPVLTEPNRSVNVQPSCLVVPSSSSPSFQSGKSSASVNQSSSLNRSPVIDYSLLSAQSSSSSLNMGHIRNGSLKTSSILGGFSAPGSFSTTSCSINLNNSTGYQNSTVPYNDSSQMPGFAHSMSNVQGLYVDKSREMHQQRPLNNLGFVGKETCIPSRFAVDDYESQMGNLNHGRIHIDNSGNSVKLEGPVRGFVDNAEVGIPILRQYSSSDFMSAFQ